MARRRRVGTASSPEGAEEASERLGDDGPTWLCRVARPRRQVSRRVCWAAAPSYLIEISTKTGVPCPDSRNNLLTSLKGVFYICSSTAVLKETELSTSVEAVPPAAAAVRDRWTGAGHAAVDRGEERRKNFPRQSVTTL